VAEDPDRPIGLAAEPIYWQETARDYVLAANYLIDWHDVSRAVPSARNFQFSHHGRVAPMMVLFAIAVENLLKAVRVAHEGTPIVNGQLASDFKHHRLLEHADRARVSLSEREGLAQAPARLRESRALSGASCRRQDAGCMALHLSARC